MTFIETWMHDATTRTTTQSEWLMGQWREAKALRDASTDHITRLEQQHRMARYDRELKALGN